MGRGIYGGIYSKDSPLSDGNGFRQDVLQVLRDELKIPLVRYPGGNFTATYHWKDGIGPCDKRPARYGAFFHVQINVLTSDRLNMAWGGVENNEFGTDEFMRWCAQAKAEPCICLNMGTGNDLSLDYCFFKLISLATRISG